MKIIIITSSKLPVAKYGGTERVLWSLGNELHKLGHKVVIVAGPGSSCPFAEVIHWDGTSNFREIIPPDHDLIHFFSDFAGEVNSPYLVTQQGNSQLGQVSSIQTVFVSMDHAARHGSDVFVHNGLDWSDVEVVNMPRKDFHFLGKAAWRRKNVRGAISVTKRLHGKNLHVLGGHRLNFSMGFRFTASPRVKFHGMVDDTYKQRIMQQSQGLVFPVRWNEPFGLAITESLYCGCPVFGTPYGSLPELVTSEVGFLSSKSIDLVEAMESADEWSSLTCRDYAVENFNSRRMALKYLDIYEQVVDGKVLNKTAPKLLDDESGLLHFK